MNEFIMNPDFNSQDVFKKHKDFIFTLSNEPMSGDTIRSVRKEIYIQHWELRYHMKVHYFRC